MAINLGDCISSADDFHILRVHGRVTVFARRRDVLRTTRTQGIMYWNNACDRVTLAGFPRIDFPDFCR